VWCSSLERHRLLFLYLQRRLPSLDCVVLHVASEACLEARLRQRFGEGYLTADFHNSRADVRMNIMDIQYPGETFDLIFCSHVLEHVEDDRKAMREFRRVLRVDGIAVLLVPIGGPARTYEDPSIVDPEARARAFGQHDHVRVYGADYVDRLQEAGFDVEILRVEDLATAEEAVQMNLSGAAGVIHVCRRSPE